MVKLIKRAPRGRPFEKGISQFRNPGGKQFVKIVQRLSTVAGEMLAERAPAEDCLLVGLEPGATKAQCIVQALYLAGINGDVSAASALFTFTESGRLREQITVNNLSIFALARNKIVDAMQGRVLEAEVVQP